MSKRKKKNNKKVKKNKAVTVEKTEQQVDEKPAQQTEKQPEEKRHLRKVGAYELDEEVAEILQDIKLHSNTMF